MFENGMAELDAAETLAATARAQTDENEAARRRLLLAAHYADLHPSPAMIPGDQTAPGRERGLYYGGPGCPAVAEFAVAEFGVVLGVSTESAAKNIGQALALRHRLPLSWKRVVAGEATPWKARQLATACQELSLDAAAIVDTRVASIIDSVGPVQLRNLVKAACWEADPEAARAAAEQKARERGVWTGRCDEHGTTAVYLKAATGDVIRFDATLNQIADALTTLDGPAPHQHQRAKAIGILADPALAHHLLQVAHYLTTHPSTPAPVSAPTSGASSAPAPGSALESPTAASAFANPLRADGPPAATNSRPGDPRPVGRASAHLLPAGQISTNPPAANQPLADRFRSSRPAEEQAPTGPAQSPDASPVENVTRDGEPASELFLADEPSMNAEADRDPPHPSSPNHPLDPPPTVRPDTGIAEELIASMDAVARRGLAAKLSAIKTIADQAGGSGPGRTKLYVHLTDETLLAGGGVMRVEGFGPVFAKLAELVGHDRIIIQPVIDLPDQINVNAYEIPDRLRERIKLAYPIEQFPYGPGETTNRTDLDHVIPYDPSGPPGQTSTGNLRPLRRRSHRIKTFAGWKVRTLDDNTLEWTTRHGYKFHVDHTGTHPTPDLL